jgi:hypothetical protein
VSRANGGITLLVPHLLAIFNVAWSLADRARVGNLSAPVMSAQIPFASGFLASQLLGSATLDRLRHNVYCMVLDGASYRTPKTLTGAAKSTPEQAAK